MIRKIIFLLTVLVIFAGLPSAFSQIPNDVVSEPGTSVYGEPRDYLIDQEEQRALQKQKQEQQEVEEIESTVTEEEPAPYPLGDQEFYEPRDASYKFNPQTGQYEQATPNQELRFNPSTGTWSYQSSTAKMKFNYDTGKWEYTDNPYE